MRFEMALQKLHGERVLQYMNTYNPEEARAAGRVSSHHWSKDRQEQKQS